jgi:L-threonylcarbamoyladenylate synthase
VESNPVTQCRLARRIGGGGEVSGVRMLQASDAEAIAKAAGIIRNGGVVAFPTETVYGLGADATNASAVARVFELKQRPSFDPLIVHVADAESAGEFGHMDIGTAGLLTARFWPGPLTIVVPRTRKVPRIVTAGLDTVAIRMPAHPGALALIRAARTAIAAPSANLFGSVSPTTAEHVSEQLPGVDLILNGGPCSVGVESTIVALTGSVPRLLRPGGIPVEEIEKVVGRVVIESRTPDVPEAPGQLSRHYATRTRLEIAPEGSAAAKPRQGEKLGVIALRQPSNPSGYASVEILSASGDMREAAARLFAALRRLDRQALDRIVAFPLAEHGLGRAIMDRLRRCAVPAE